MLPLLACILLVIILVVCWVWSGESYSYTGPILVAVISIVLIGGYLVYDYTQTETRTIVVEGKDRGADDGSYRVYTDGATLSVKDIYLSAHPRTNTADVFGDIRVCHRYEVTVRGWEFGLASAMPNIVSVDKDLGPVEGCQPPT